MKNKIFSIQAIAEVGVFAAIGYVLDLIQGSISASIFPNGGSIGIAMAIVLLISYRRGTICGVLCGLIMGLLDLMDGFYAISDSAIKVFTQVALDYWIAYPLVGLAGIFMKPLHSAHNNKKRIFFIIIGAIIGCGLKYMAHFLSGVLFWPNDMWGGPFLYSLIYNFLYIFPSTILSITLLLILMYKYPKFMLLDDLKLINEKKDIM